MRARLLVLCCVCVWCCRGCAWRCCFFARLIGVLFVRGRCCCAAFAFWCILGKRPPASMRSSTHPTRRANQSNYKRQPNSWTSRPAACFLLQPQSRCRKAPTPSRATPQVTNHLPAVVHRPITAPLLHPSHHYGNTDGLHAHRHQGPPPTGPTRISNAARRLLRIRQQAKR